MTWLPKITPGFKTELVAKPSPEDGPEFSRLKENLVFISGISGRKYVTKRGFPTDYASFRIGDFQLRGKTDRPSVLHDDLYASGLHYKWFADILFYEACRLEGLNRFRASIRFLGVFLAPKAHKAWRAPRGGDTPGARFYAAQKGPQIDSTTNHP